MMLKEIIYVFDAVVRNEYRGSYVATVVVETNEFSYYISVILYRFTQYNYEVTSSYNN